MALGKNWKVAVALAALFGLLPAVIFDLLNFQSLYYASLFDYWATKIIVWLLLPCLVFAMLQRLSYASRALYVLALWYIIFTGFAYGSSWVGAAVTAALFVACWMSLESVIVRLYLTPLFLSVTLMLYAGYSGVYLAEHPAQIAPQTKPQKSGVEFGAYIILLDELSYQALLDAGRISERYPNLRDFSKVAQAAPRAIANYDITALAVPSLLAGRMLTGCNNRKTLGCYEQPNFFDYADPSKVFVWGPYGQPYCRSLRKKGIASYCLDETSQFEDLDLGSILELDLRRMWYLHVVNVPLSLLHAFSVSAGIRLREDPVYGTVLARLENYRRYSEYYLWRYNLIHELERFKDMLGKIGSVKGGVYFYHSNLPHYPFAFNAEFERHEDFRDMSYEFAETEDDMARITKRYENSIKAADRVFGDITKRIRERDPDSLIIVSSDHGVARSLEKGINRYKGRFLKEVVEIPFFLSLPKEHFLRDRPLSAYQHLDFLPTLCDVLNIECPADLPGKSVLRDGESDFFFISADKMYRLEGRSSF